MNTDALVKAGIKTGMFAGTGILISQVTSPFSLCGGALFGTVFYWSGTMIGEQLQKFLGDTTIERIIGLVVTYFSGILTTFVIMAQIGYKTSFFASLCPALLMLSGAYFINEVILPKLDEVYLNNLLDRA